MAEAAKAVAQGLALTGEQAAIVSGRGQDMLVTAGAGSGKTRVLVERYLSLLTEHRIPEIAAVTFTDAAAMEMRERVRSELLSRPDLAHHHPDIDEAVIGTIHSLCFMILREHPVEAAIDPAARVLAEDEAEFELFQACIDAMEDAAEQEDHRALALRELSVRSITPQLPHMVQRRDEVEDAFRSMGEGIDEWRDHIQGRLGNALGPAVEEIRPQIAEGVEWLRDAYKGPGEDALCDRMPKFLEALGNPSEGDATVLLHRMQAAEKFIHLRAGSARNWADIDRIRDIWAEFRARTIELSKIPVWNEHDETALEVLDSLRALFRDACQRYLARKRELAALDYLDLEIEATRLLREHPQVAALYQDRFRHLMVDELQDTNPAQIALLERLSYGGGDGTQAPQRFFVGDVKQAIYRFRGGDVRNFTRLHRHTEQTGAIHALSQSFRAHNPLVQTVNTIFEAVFRDPQEDFEAPMQAMTGRGDDRPRTPHLVLMPISTAKVDDTNSQGEDRRRMEADAIAHEIAQLLKEETPVWDRESKQVRPAEPADVAVLLRRFSNVHLFEQSLESHGVPYRTPTGAGFFTRQEVLDLTNLLTWLAEPDDNIALVGALRSPLFMIDDRTLLALRSNRSDLLRLLKNPPDGVDGEERDLCTRAAEVLTDLGDRVPLSAVDVLLERALELTAFEAAWAPLQGGDQALANIRKFVELSRTLADHSLDEFVTYVQRRRDELEARESQAVLDESDAVKLLTIHGAKGLEFPIVFVPEAHVTPPRSWDSVRWRSAEGVSITLTPPEEGDTRRRPGFYSYLMERDNAEDDAEHKRLFYVACTRAADLLYVSGDEGDKAGSWLSAAINALDGMPADGVEIRPPLAVDLDGIARRGSPNMPPIPREEDEEDFMPPLVARPRVIPLRSSTPVTALQAPLPAHAYGHRHSDGLGLVRGSLAHKAIEVWFTSGARPDLPSLVEGLDASLSDTAMTRVMGEVGSMLDLLDLSPLAATLRDSDTRAYFELPFSWDWDGVPIHGTIDLAYQTSGNWHLLDFKTDDLRGRPLAAAAQAYLPQLALYASALSQATGQQPVTGLLFLRTGDIYTPPAGELERALSETRLRIDAGALLEPEMPSAFEEFAEFS